MLIAAIRTGHALAGKAVTYNEEDGRFWLTGSGEIPAARLLEYDDRRELDWADDVTREWALEMASILARKQAAEERQHEAAAAAATAEAARLEALAPPSVVYPPPDTTPPPPDGIPAVAPTFELSPEARDRRPRWVVWAEAAPDAAAATGTGGTEAPAGREVAAAPPRHAITAPGQTPGTGPDRPVSATSPAWPDASGMVPVAPAVTPAMPASAPSAPGPADPGQRSADATSQPTSRHERRGAQRERSRQSKRSGARLRIAAYVLVGAVAAALLYLVQRGGF